MNRFYAGLIQNKVFANVVLLSIIVLAIAASAMMIRESEPELNIPIILVTVSYPGADPEEVESSISSRIDGAIESIQGIKRFTSTSSEGFSQIQIEVKDGYPVNVVKDRVQSAVESIQSFPEGAETPRIRQASDSEQVMLVTIWGELPERQLKELASEVYQDLQALPEVSNVQTVGSRQYEIAIEAPQANLERYGLSLADISRAVQRSHVESAGGTIPLTGEEVRVRAMGRRRFGSEFEAIPVAVRPDGSVVRLSDVADIRDDFSETLKYTRYNGHPCATLTVQKIPGEDAIKIAEAVRAYVEEKALTMPPGVNISPAFDNTFFVRSQLRLITRNGLLGLFFVLAVLWIFLEGRLAFWVAMGIPISLGGAVVLLWLVGATLNQISLVAMIVVMGIIVDDAIVVGEAIYVHRKRGKKPTQAALDGIREVGIPVIASVTTTITAFMPLAFVPGIFGQFSRQMPMVVVAALIVSLVECLFLLPAHLNHPNRRPSRTRHRLFSLGFKSKVEHGLDRFVDTYYVPFVRWGVRQRYTTLCGGIGLILVTGGLIGGGHLPVVMWPGVEGDFIDANIEFAPGTPPEKVVEGVRHLEEALYRAAESIPTKVKEPLVEFVYTSAPNNSEVDGSIEIAIVAAGKRDFTQNEFIQAWREAVGEMPGVLSLSFEGESIGNSGQTDIGYWLQGRDFDELRVASMEFREKLAEYEGVFQIRDNFRTGKSELHIRLKPAAHSLGLTETDISRQLSGTYLGHEALRLQRGREELQVRVRLPREERQSWEGFDRIRIRTPEGHEVPLQTVADVEMQHGVTSIVSNNGVRGVYVSAEVDRQKANPGEINTEIIETYLPVLVQNHPSVNWSLSGAEEENRAFMAALARNSIIAMLVIFVILATVFRSYVQPLIIMFIIPYGLVGAAVGHLILGIPFSFLSFAGITALAGVLVNDSIVLIERINANLAEGMSLEDAVCEGGRRRFRAIFLTSISTCVGLAPLIVETDLQAQIVIPMAVSIASGVAFGTMLTLILIPAFLVIMNDLRRILYRVLRGTWPTPEEVEPARTRLESDDAMEGNSPVAVT